MPINTKSLAAGGVPETTDGRRYPRYLRSYERYDGELLAKVAELEQPSLNELAISFSDAKMRSVISPWLASAEWRDLIERTEPSAMVGNRHYRLTERGEERLAELN